MFGATILWLVLGSFYPWIARAVSSESGHAVGTVQIPVELPSGKEATLHCPQHSLTAAEHAIEQFLHQHGAFSSNYARRIRSLLVQKRLVPLGPFTIKLISEDELKKVDLKLYHGDELSVKIVEALASMLRVVEMRQVLSVYDSMFRHLEKEGLLEHVRLTDGGRFVGGWEGPSAEPWNDSVPSPDPTVARFDLSCPSWQRSVPPLLDPFVIEALPADTEFRRKLKQVVAEEFDLDRFRELQRPVPHVISGRTHLVHPLGFSVPSSEISGYVPTKTQVLAHVLPGNMDTYVFQGDKLETEQLYRSNYSQSFFGVTFKKAGWDCLRHLEILASGTAPLFPDIDSCPQHTMAHYPKRLLGVMLEFPGLRVDRSGNFSLPSTYNFDPASFDLPAYFAATDALLQITRARLTTIAAARRILEVLDVCAKSALILPLDFDQDGDYETDMLIHGFKKLLGAGNVVDFPRRRAPHQSESSLVPEGHEALIKGIRGSGFTFCCRVQELGASVGRDQEAIRRRVRERDFDVVVVTMIDRMWLQSPLLADVCTAYPRSRVAIVHGGDKPIVRSEIARYTSCGVLFSREIDPDFVKYL